jgi:AcrR family transcriptional regulator
MATSRRQPDVTRAVILEAARESFGSLGYISTNTEDLVRNIGLTRGALYHHFDGKEALFRAVTEWVVNESVAKVSTPLSEQGDQWDIVIEGMLRYLDLCLEPGNMQILVVDAPVILGLSTVAMIAEQALGRRWDTVLRHCMRLGLIVRLPAAALGHVLATAVSEASIFVANAESPRRARRDVDAVLIRILNGLRLTDLDGRSPI